MTTSALVQMNWAEAAAAAAAEVDEDTMYVSASTPDLKEGRVSISWNRCRIVAVVVLGSVIPLLSTYKIRLIVRQMVECTPLTSLKYGSSNLDLHPTSHELHRNYEHRR